MGEVRRGPGAVGQGGGLNKINMQRIKSFDLARGFTVLMIAPIHTMLVYSRLETRDTCLGYFLAFIAEGPGAQLFMLLMGVYVAFSKPKPFDMVFLRSFVLLVAGYALNILKFALPMKMGWLPDSLLPDLQAGDNPYGYAQVIFMGDILAFAAIALLILYFVKQHRKYHELAVWLAIFVALGSPFFWDLRYGYPVVDYLLQLLGGHPPVVFFPLFPWLVYPLVGLTIGYWLQNNPRGFNYFNRIGITGAALLLTGYCMREFITHDPSPSFYRTNPADTLIHIGIVLVWLWIWERQSNHYKPNLFFKSLSWASKNITLIYFIQWILILWMTPFFGYQNLDMPGTLIAIAFTSGWTMVITYFINHYQKKYANK